MRTMYHNVSSVRLAYADNGYCSSLEAETPSIEGPDQHPVFPVDMYNGYVWIEKFSIPETDAERKFWKTDDLVNESERDIQFYYRVQSLQDPGIFIQYVEVFSLDLELLYQIPFEDNQTVFLYKDHAEIA